jgi:hypothetical protein
MNWADELGIDLGALRSESPLHPTQLRARRAWEKHSAEFWERQRFLDMWGFAPEPVVVETPEPKPVKVRVKRAKVVSYEFTDAQLEIAFRSLNAGGAV